MSVSGVGAGLAVEMAIVVSLAENEVWVGSKSTNRVPALWGT